MRWADIPGFEGYYEVSDTGDVRSKDRTTSYGQRRKGVELKPSRSGRYMRVTLSKDGKLHHEGIHRLVLMAFKGVPEDHKAHVMHLNNDTVDNRLENLRWDTNSENLYQSSQERRHHYSRKTECSRGHLLEPWNLRPVPDRRECLACCQARNFFKSAFRSKELRTEEKLQERSDYYYKILKESEVPMPSGQLVGGYAAAHMEQEYGRPRVTRQLASGVAVHFGEQAMFIPGRDPERLKANIQQKIQELACAYVAWEYAEEHPEERDEMS